MAINKVTYMGETLIDLTSDTVTADTLAKGAVAHGANGESIVGVAEIGSGSGSAGLKALYGMWGIEYPTNWIGRFQRETPSNGESFITGEYSQDINFKVTDEEGNEYSFSKIRIAVSINYPEYIDEENEIWSPEIHNLHIYYTDISGIEHLVYSFVWNTDVGFVVDESPSFLGYYWSFIDFGWEAQIVSEKFYNFFTFDDSYDSEDFACRYDSSERPNFPANEYRTEE